MTDVELRGEINCEVQDGTCHLCGDEAVSGRVMSIDGTSGTAMVDFGGTQQIVALDLVDATVGDTLLVHLGFAIARLEPV